MSADPRKKLEEEIQALEKELREALKTAAALGDLSENADYSAARERQDFVRARLGQLKQRLADLSLVNFDKIPRDRISLGSTVVLLDVDKDEEVTYRLVTSEDANVNQGLISTTSPIGKSLLNKKEGDEVEVKIPSGSRTFEILRFTTLHDQNGGGSLIRTTSISGLLGTAGEKSGDKDQCRQMTERQPGPNQHRPHFTSLRRARSTATAAARCARRGFPATFRS